MNKGREYIKKMLLIGIWDISYKKAKLKFWFKPPEHDFVAFGASFNISQERGDKYCLSLQNRRIYC